MAPYQNFLTFAKTRCSVPQSYASGHRAQEESEQIHPGCGLLRACDRIRVPDPHLPQSCDLSLVAVAAGFIVVVLVGGGDVVVCCNQTAVVKNNADDPR